MPISRKVRFGAFEVDLQERELRHRGIRIHLQNKPFQILELLLQKPGALVTRTELARRLWPDLHVNFGHGLNTAINTLRQALGDSSTSCHFIETRSGLGYRFVAAVEEVLEPRSIEEAGKAEPSPRHTPKPEAEQDYRKAKYLQTKMADSDLGKSIAHFRAAIAQDPEYALAYAGLAQTYIEFALRGVLPGGEAHRQADEFTRLALRIDDQLAEGQAARGALEMFFARAYGAAERAYSRAVELDSACPEAHRGYATLLSVLGRTGEALRERRMAQKLEPLSLWIHVEAARDLYMAREFEGCIEQCWQALVLEAEFAPAQHMLGLAYEQLGMYEEATTELRNACLSSREKPAFLAALGHSYAKAGGSDEVAGVLKDLEELARRRYLSPYWRGLIAMGSGDLDTAFHFLRAAFEDGEAALVWLKVDPRFDFVRAEPRFQELLGRAGLCDDKKTSR